MFTREDLYNEVEMTLEGFEDEFNIDNIVEEIVTNYGLVSVTTIDVGEYDALLNRHDYKLNDARI